MSDDFDRHRQHFPWMSDEQFECYGLLCELYFGAHHVASKSVKAFGLGIKYSTRGDLATYDYDGLTRLVRIAHERCIRASIVPGGPGRIAIALHKRKREGKLYERHPTWESLFDRAIEKAEAGK